MELIDRIENLLEITDRLADLVEDENEALADRRTKDVEAMVEEKTTLARLYQNRMKVVKEQDVDWSEVDPDLHKQLVDAAKRLDIAMKENKMRLEVSIKANQKVLSLVAKAVEKSRPHSGTYSRKGAKGNEGATASANSVSISVDQTL